MNLLENGTGPNITAIQAHKSYRHELGEILLAQKSVLSGELLLNPDTGENLLGFLDSFFTSTYAGKIAEILIELVPDPAGGANDFKAIYRWDDSVRRLLLAVRAAKRKFFGTHGSSGELTMGGTEGD